MRKLLFIFLLFLTINLKAELPPNAQIPIFDRGIVCVIIPDDQNGAYLYNLKGGSSYYYTMTAATMQVVGAQIVDGGMFGKYTDADGVNDYLVMDDEGKVLDWEWNEPHAIFVIINSSFTMERAIICRILDTGQRGWEFQLAGAGNPHYKMINAWTANCMSSGANGVGSDVRKERYKYNMVGVTSNGSGNVSGIKYFVNGRVTTSYVDYSQVSATIKQAGLKIACHTRKNPNWGYYGAGMIHAIIAYRGVDISINQAQQIYRNVMNREIEAVH